METMNETREAYQRAMGEQAGSAFYLLFCEVCYLYQKWGQYAELFGLNEERIMLLNRAAPAFLGTLQRILWNDVLLHVARINDDPYSGGAKRRNLTLFGFVEMVPENDFKTELIEKAEEAKRSSQFCRDWRNRLLAHVDFDLAMKNPTRDIEYASRLKIKEALVAITNFMNVVDARYGGCFLPFSDEQGREDVQGFLCVLNDGLQLEELRLSYVREGKIVPDALRSRPL